MMPSTLRPAVLADHGALTEIFVRAFLDDPIFVWLLPDAGTRASKLRWLAERWLRGRARDQITASEPPGGMLVGVHPGGEADLSMWAQIRLGLLAMPFVYGLGAFRRFLAADADIRRRHRVLTEPHFIIDILAVDPPVQGQGLGARLARVFLDGADQAGVPCFLLTHNPRNVPFYRRLGFEVIEEAPVPPGPVICWSMRRPG
jgi:GNAT superfamily N-acetyltransferase